MEEKDYRRYVENTYRQIETLLENVDPDDVDFDLAQGALTLTFSDRTKCILSQQPSVKQLWLALASRGIAHHFNYDLQSRSWRDDKGKGVELVAFVSGLIKEASQKR